MRTEIINFFVCVFAIQFLETVKPTLMLLCILLCFSRAAMNNIQQLIMILNSATDKPSDTLIMYFNVSDYEEDLCRILGITTQAKYTPVDLMHMFLKQYIYIGLV